MKISLPLKSGHAFDHGVEGYIITQCGRGAGWREISLYMTVKELALPWPYPKSLATFSHYMPFAGSDGISHCLCLEPPSI